MSNQKNASAMILDKSHQKDGKVVQPHPATLARFADHRSVKPVFLYD